MTNKEEIIKLYNEWWSNWTPEEYALQGMCYEYEKEYFEERFPSWYCMRIWKK